MNAPATVTVGQRFRLVRDVERYPHFIARAGALGTVTDTSDGICLRLDEHLPGAEEWDNEVVWSDADLPELPADTERVMNPTGA